MAGRSDKTGTASAPASAAGRRPSAVAAPQAMRATRLRRRKLLGVLISVLLVAAAFAGGFFARGNEALMDSLGISPGGSREEVNPGMTVHGLTQTSISARIAEVEGILSQLSLDSYDLDTLTAALMRSFVDTTADPYLR